MQTLADLDRRPITYGALDRVEVRVEQQETEEELRDLFKRLERIPDEIYRASRPEFAERDKEKVRGAFIELFARRMQKIKRAA